jgi:hypothetical protein
LNRAAIIRKPLPSPAKNIENIFTEEKFEEWKWPAAERRNEAIISTDAGDNVHQIVPDVRMTLGDFLSPHVTVEIDNTDNETGPDTLNAYDILAMNRQGKRIEGEDEKKDTCIDDPQSDFVPFISDSCPMSYLNNQVTTGQSPTHHHNEYSNLRASTPIASLEARLSNLEMMVSTDLKYNRTRFILPFHYSCLQQAGFDWTGN